MKEETEYLIGAFVGMLFIISGFSLSFITGVFSSILGLIILFYCLKKYEEKKKKIN